MNRKVIIAGAAGIALALTAAYAAYRFGLSRAERQEGGQRIDAATGKRVLYWHDPMVPAQRFDKPGKSPFMDMQLVPVYADDAKEAGGVPIDSRAQQRLGARPALAEKKSLATEITAAGTVEYNERDVAVGPRTPGVPGLGHRPKLTGPCVNDRRGVTLSHAPPTTPTERTPHDLLTVAAVESVYESEARAIPRSADRVVPTSCQIREDRASPCQGFY